MPAISSLVLTDRATTPVAHTLVPIGKDAQGVWTLEKSVSTPIGAPQLTISARRVAGKRFKARLVLKVPVVQDETVNGIVKPTIVRTGFAELSFTFDPSSSEQERKDVVGMIQSALDASKVLTNDTLTKMQGIY